MAFRLVTRQLFGQRQRLAAAYYNRVVVQRSLTSYVQNDLPSLIDMKQGDKVVNAFSEREIESRLEKLRRYMSENDMVGVVLTSHCNINYYTGGFVYCSFGRNYGLVVTEDKSVVISAGVDGCQPWRRSVIGDNMTYTDWQKDNYFKAVTSSLQNKKGKIGLEFDHVSLQNFEKFEKALPNNKKVDISTPTMHMRFIKSEEEIEVIRKGSEIGEIGGAACVEALFEGVPEYEVALAANASMTREIAKFYPKGEVMDTWSWIQSGINTAGAHNPLTTRRIMKGDIISLNCFPMISGYYTAFERTMFLDHATDKQIDLWEKNCQVHRRGVELIKPGIKCKDIALELNDMYNQFDLLKYRNLGYGHSFGSMCHYYGREIGLEIREDVETVLEPNMVMSMEPMITIPIGMDGAGGYKEHDIIILTENGAENITKFPFGPEHNIIKK